MPFVNELKHASAFALLTVIIGVVPMITGLIYAIRPSERRLALMRPLSLAASFGALSGVMSGFINILSGISATEQFTTNSFRMIALGASEALVPVFTGFGCLTVAWLLVALGMRRTTE